jgi:NTE family protein
MSLARRYGPALQITTICFLLLSAVGYSREQVTPPVPEPPLPDRPRIGLALSGGGARGMAHVGVLKMLEEHRIPVDYIAGTSMGAIVGGLYASGLSADELEVIFTDMDWDQLFEDESSRRDRAFRRKEEDQRYLMGFEVGFSQGKLVLPRGVRSGRKLLFKFRDLTLPVAGTEDFSDLPIPFTAVATDIESGEMILLDNGDLPLSMLASASIPGVIAPVRLNDRRLVDGGLVRNIPTDIVRQMGADIVITVDIGSQLLSPDQLESLLGITSQAMEIISLEGNREMRDAADILLTPSVAALSTLDFSEIESTISLGEEGAREKLPVLTPLSLSEEEYDQYRSEMKKSDTGSTTIVFTGIEGLKRIDQRTIWNRMHLEPGEDLDIVQLERDLDLIFGLGDFQFIDYRLFTDPDGIGVVISVREKPWAPNYIHGAVKIAIDDDQNTSFDLLTNLTIRPMNALNAEWRTDLVLGNQQWLGTEFYQPLDFSGRFFVAAGLLASRVVTDLFVEQKHTAEFKARSLVGQCLAGITFGTWGEFRLGLSRGLIDYSLEEGFQPEGFVDSSDTGGWSSSLAIDTLDSVYFPRKGGLFAASFYSSQPSLGADERYDGMAFNGVYAKSWGRHTMLTWLEGGSNSGDEIPGFAWFGLGGLFSMSAYDHGELVGQHYAVFRPTYFYRIANLPSVLGKGVYLGGWVEAGNAWIDSEDVSIDDLRFATTLILGAETIMGPFYFAYGVAEEGRQRWYLSIGSSFGGTRPGS